MKKLLILLLIAVMGITGMGAKPPPSKFQVDTTACYVNWEAVYGGTYSCDLIGTGAAVGVTTCAGEWWVTANDGKIVTVSAWGSGEDANYRYDGTTTINVNIRLMTIRTMIVDITITDKATGIQTQATQTMLTGSYVDELFNGLEFTIRGRQ